MVNFLICINRLLHSIHATHNCRIIWCKWVSIPVSTNGTNLLCWELLIHMIHYPILLGFQMLKLNQQHVWILIYSPIFWYVKNALGFSSVNQHEHRSNPYSTLKFLFSVLDAVWKHCFLPYSSFLESILQICQLHAVIAMWQLEPWHARMLESVLDVSITILHWCFLPENAS